MTKQLSVLTLVLIGVAGLAQAQSGPPLDPHGHPWVGANDWTRSPGDPMPGHEAKRSHEDVSQARTTMHEPDRDRHEEAFKDEFGFRYDRDGNRLDRHGHVISPHSTTP
ncbi:MAG: hypothetical protein ACHQK9_19730 [Reyranellales bacterium]